MRFWLNPTRVATTAWVSLCRLRVDTSSWPSCDAVSSSWEVGVKDIFNIRYPDKFSLAEIRIKSIYPNIG